MGSGLDDVSSGGDAIEDGLSEPGVGDHLGLLGEGQVGGQDDRGLLRSLSNEPEEELGAEVYHGHVAEFVDGDQLMAIPACESPLSQRR